jgi:hypothetical protein
MEKYPIISTKKREKKMDKMKGITQVQKPQEIIEEKHRFARENNLPEQDYTSELSKKWVWGLLDGVPPKPTL